MMLLDQTDGRISERLQAHLDQVEARFTSELRSDLDCVNTLTRHVERYRGKMLRPTLVLISAMAGGQSTAGTLYDHDLAHPSASSDASDSSDGSDFAATAAAWDAASASATAVVDAERESMLDPSAMPDEPHHILGAVVEMVHMATLVHDDILDEAETRRGGATLNHLSGNEAAVMLGDFLISHAYHLCSCLGRPEISREIAQATNTICEGELLQLANRNNWQLQEQTYFEIIRRKTASLCGTCCRLGLVLARSDDQPEAIGEGQSPHADDLTEGMQTYGSKLGIAFQIVDDLLDLTGDPETVGKTLGRDLEKGKLTLPLIRFLDQTTPAQRTQTLSWLREQADGKSGPGGSATRQRAAADLQQRLMDTDALAYAQGRAQRLVQEAKAALTTSLSPSPARTVMLDMADAVLHREG